MIIKTTDYFNRSGRPERPKYDNATIVVSVVTGERLFECQYAPGWMTREEAVQAYLNKRREEDPNFF